jgi:hypothetical protein
LSDPRDEDEIAKFFTPVLKAVLESLGITAGTPEVYKMIYPGETPTAVRKLPEYLLKGSLASSSKQPFERL